MYGEQIALTYKGESQFKSMPGAIVTCLVLVTLLAFASYRLFILTTRLDPDVSKQSFIQDLDIEPAMILDDYGFNLAFGLKNPLEPSVGSFVVNRVHNNYIYTKDGKRKRNKTRTDVNFQNCGHD